MNIKALTVLENELNQAPARCPQQTAQHIKLNCQVEILDTDPLRYLTAILPGLIAVTNSAGVTIGLLSIIILLFLSAMISGSEVALFSLSPSQMHEMRTGQTRSDQTVIHLLEKPKRLLATILISNNFINVAIVVISTYITNQFFAVTSLPVWAVFLIQVVVVTALILFFGEVLPKVYASQRNVQFARIMARPILFLTRVFYPLSSMLVRSTRVIDKKMVKKGYNISMSELSDAIELTSDETTPRDEKKILQGIVKFGDIEVKEIMKSRMDVTAVDVETSFPELLNVIIDAGYSRIPVYEGSFDTVKGILYIKDLLSHLDRKDNFSWQGLLRDAFFVPENKKISDLLEEFQQKKIHMAIVVDEYGGTSGIVTLEDIIEEIVGDISDEHDVPLEESKYVKLDERTYIFEGKTTLNDVCKILEIDNDIFDSVKGDSDTIAGLILELMEKMPEKDERINYRNFLFTVKSVDKRRIKRVQVRIEDDKSAQEEEKKTER